MKKQIINFRERRGVSLIITVGILSLLVIIATSFAVNMQLEYRAAINQLNHTKATALAEAGIEKVMADIRNWAGSVTYTTLINNIEGYPTTETTLSDGSYEITIEREEEKVNINAIDPTDYIWIDRLYSEGSSAGLTYADIGKIMDYRDGDSDVTTELLATSGGTLGVRNISGAANNEENAKNAPYATIEELRVVLTDPTGSKYDAIKDIITISTPIIKGGLIGEYYQIDQGESFSQNTILDLDHYKGKVIEMGPIRTAYDTVAGTWDDMFPGADGADEATDAEWAGSSTVFFGFNTSGAIFTGFIYIPQDKINQSIAFYLAVDDGGRLYLDGEKIIESWGIEQGLTEYSGAHTFQFAGWHPIKIEYVEAYGWNQCELKWNGLGSKDYVPAEYLGYYPVSYYGKIHSDIAGSAYLTPSVLSSDYNSGGIFKVVAKGKVKRADGTVLAERQVTTVLDIFGTWTQTTKADFYAAWASLYNDFSDGEIRNVNWMNTCPTDTDSWSGTAMHWDQAPTTVSDSLKLGYWTNLDEDLSYSVVTLKGGKRARLMGWGQAPADDGSWDMENHPECWGETEVKNYYGTDYNVPKAYYWITDKTTIGFGEVSSGNWYTPSSGYVLKIQTLGYDDKNADHYIQQGANPPETPAEDKDAEIDGNCYASSSALGSDIFVRTHLFDNGVDKVSGAWGCPPSTRRDSASGPTYVPSWLVGRLDVKEQPYPLASNDLYTLLKDGNPDWNSDLSELTINPGSGQQISASYPAIGTPYVLALIAKGSSYQSYYSNGSLITGAAGSASVTEGVVKFRGINTCAVDTNTDWWVKRVSDRGLDWCEALSTNEALFDNIRVIYPQGYLVSTPFVMAYPTDNADITWGTISWTADAPASTSITMYARADDTLAAGDTFSTTVTNGGELSGFTGKRIQYKALLQTTAINNANYTGSSVTPVLKDVTVTYLPQVEVLYRQ